MEDGLNLILFISRKKDNTGILGYKRRECQFLTDKQPNDPEIMEKFSDFVGNGVYGELSRYYCSVNKRDSKKVQNSIIHHLIDNDTRVDKLNWLAAKIAAKPENRLENKWLFDFDLISENCAPKLEDFVEDIVSESGDSSILELTSDTITGYHVIVKHGFDTRKLLEKYPNVELKRDDMRLISYMENNLKNNIYSGGINGSN